MSVAKDRTDLSALGELTISKALTFNRSNPEQSTYSLKFTPNNANTINIESKEIDGTISLEIVAYLNPEYSYVPSVRNENRIITKSSVTRLLAGYDSLERTFKEMRFAINNQSDYTLETSPAGKRLHFQAQ